MAVEPLKDEMIIYVDSPPIDRIAAPKDTMFWRHDKEYFLIHPVTNKLTKLESGFIKDKKYETPFYTPYQFIYANLDETWIKVSADENDKKGWMFVCYCVPTIAGLNGGPQPTPTPPTPTPTPTPTMPTGSGSCCSNFFITNVYTSSLTGTFYFITQSSFDGHIGLPTDGYYGEGTAGSPSGLLEGDLMEDAFDKLDSMIGKLIPPKPSGLMSKSITLVGAYAAKMENTSTVYTTLTASPTPQFQLVGGMTPTNAFYDGANGTLHGVVNGTSVGSRPLSASSDVGVYGGLEITYDGDFYAGQIGKAGFWYTLLAQLNVPNGTISTVGPHTARLFHSITGNTPNYTFYLDDPVAPTNVAQSITGSGISYISGVPALVGGQNNASIIATGSADRTVGRFYNKDHIFTLAGSGVSTTDFPLLSIPISASHQVSNMIVPVSQTRTEAASFTVTAFNSANGTTPTTLNTTIRMDYPLEIRVQSDQGQFPTTYGGTFVRNEDLRTPGNEELQFLNGKFRYPTGNYTAAKPVAGPDYTTVPTGTWSSMRWATFNLGSYTSMKNVTLTFNNADNFTDGDPQSPVLPGFALYAKVEGQTGWVDGNAAYGPIENPSANGDPALDFSKSTKTVRNVNFGTIARTGVVYVRVGIPVGSSKRFSDITLTVG